MKVAVIGSGVAGLVAAHRLHPRHEVTVFEAAPRLGGHTNTVRVDLADETHHIDTGFIVHNERNYPALLDLLGTLGVATQASDMSFSVSDARTGLEYGSRSPGTWYAQRANLVRPWFHRLLAEVVRFNRSARQLLGTSGDEHRSIDDLLHEWGFGERFRRLYLVPLGSAIWSADPGTFLAFPARSLARFFDQHGLLDGGGGIEWRTIVGGAQRYVDAISRPFAHRIRLATPVWCVAPLSSGGVRVSLADGSADFDHVVVAAHSDQALAMLATPTPLQREVLGAIRYQPNTAVLHTDQRALPRHRRAWSSWNTFVPDVDEPRPTVTYHMNRLQRIESRTQFCVTLNRDDDIDPSQVLGRFEYAHPIFDASAVAAQARQDEVNADGPITFAGAYWGYGFHEDGVRSAASAVARVEAIR